MGTKSSMPWQITRRGFLGGVAAGAMGVAGAALATGCAPTKKESSSLSSTAGAEAGTPSFMNAPEPIDLGSVTETMDTEVLIIGGATAGSFTAASCIENGLNVIVIEKNEEPRKIGRDYGFVNPKPQLDAGLPRLDPYVLTRDHVEKSAHRCKGDVAYCFMSRSGEAGDWFIDKCASWGLYPEVQQYSSVSDFYPNYTHVINFYPEGGRTEDRYATIDMIYQGIQREITESGSQYLTGIKAEQLIKDESGAVTGAVCTNADGEYIRINASKGVVLATGDYGADTEMFNYYSEWPFEEFDMFESTGTGDGHKMGLWIGAKMQDGPHPMMTFHDAYPYHFMRVNKRGKRFVNEDSGYVGGTVSVLRQPDHAAWMICDSDWATKIPESLAYGGGMAWDQDFRPLGTEWKAEQEQEEFDYFREAGYLTEGNTFEELADNMGLDSEAKANFVATCKRRNEMAAAGLDDEFGERPELLKCSTLDTPPFYAVKMITDLGVTCGGLLTDVDSRILDEEENPIPGLYGVGLVTGSLFGLDYNEVTVPGISLARNVTFGWLLGQHLAKA